MCNLSKIVLPRILAQPHLYSMPLASYCVNSESLIKITYTAMLQWINATNSCISHLLLRIPISNL